MLYNTIIDYPTPNENEPLKQQYIDFFSGAHLGGGKKKKRKRKSKKRKSKKRKSKKRRTRRR